LKRTIATILILAGMMFAQTARHTAKPAPTTRQTTDASLQQKKPAANLPSEATVTSFIQHYFGYNPGLIFKVDGIHESGVPGLAEVFATAVNGEQRQTLRFYVSADQKHAIFGDAVPFGADPFAPQRTTLEQKTSGPWRGDAKSKVLIVEFSDLQCPHCKAAMPILEQLVNEEPQVKFVFQSFPLPMHDWAQKAAQYADCVGQKNNDAFWKFVDGVFAVQETLTAPTADQKLTEIATSSGVDGSAIAACAVSPAAAERVKKSFDLGRELDITGTPTVFVNGRRISSVTSLPYEELKSIVDYEVKNAGAAK
jgi:protein-disulfide isomerase